VHIRVKAGARRTRKILCILGRDSSQVSQIAFIANKHDYNIVISMVSEFLEPTSNIIIGDLL